LLDVKIVKAMKGMKFGIHHEAIETHEDA